MAKSDLGYQVGLLSFIRPTTVMRLIPRLPSTAGRRAGRTAAITAAGIVGLPFQGWESLRHGTRRTAVELDKPPVFIIGHWRSGTTHLHNLMSQDPQFGCLRMFQALAPDFSLSTRRWLPRLLDRAVPGTRPMDNMVWPMDAPQEEEIPLAKLTPHSWYLQFLFPRDAIATFGRSVLFDAAPARARREVKRKLDFLLRTASLHEGGKRLLLKNPVNTARISLLLELYPDARFIFMHRSPYEVFPSTLNLHQKILALTSLQSITRDQIETNVLEIYRLLLQRYLEERDLVAPHRLVEVAYDELDTDPVGTLEEIYRRVGIDGFDEARPHIETYVDSQHNYRKNQFAPLSERRRELIDERWAFAFKEWPGAFKEWPSAFKEWPGAFEERPPVSVPQSAEAV